MRNCAECGVYACRENNLEKLPDDCPMRVAGEVYTDALGEYEDENLARMAKCSALTEFEGYGKWTRIEEVMEFCKKMDFKKLGIAFCSGLRDEARMVSRVFRANGFEVCGVMCKTGSVPKEEMGITNEEKVNPGTFEPICNPVVQAKLLNYQETDFNVLVGLCVGHDSIFFKYSDAPVTVLIAKDRVLAHNPCGAVYSYHFYEKKLKNHKIT